MISYRSGSDLVGEMCSGCEDCKKPSLEDENTMLRSQNEILRAMILLFTSFEMDRQKALTLASAEIETLSKQLKTGKI